MHSGNTTRGLRTIDPTEFAVKDAADYFTHLQDQGIVLEKSDRLAIIQSQVKQLAEQVHGRDLPDEALLSEVANLVEAPTSLVGSFDPGYLQLPREVLSLGDEKTPALFCRL